MVDSTELEMPNSSKIVVLIADDEPSTVAMLSSHLRSKGYSVLEASDGDQAWELAHEHLPHLVILDVMMPGMSGWEVCRKIREAVSLAHTGVIMLTGIGESLNEMTSPLYGADAHVDKPFEFTVLDDKIQDTLDRRKQGALGRPDSGADEASMAIEDDDLPTLPPAAPKRASKVPLHKPLAKTKPSLPPAAKAAPKKKAAKASLAKPSAPAMKAAPKPATKKAAPKPAAKKAAPKPAAKKAAPKPAKKAAPKPAAKKAAPKPAAKKAAPKPVKKAAAKSAPAKAAKAPAAKKKAAPKMQAKAMPSKGKPPTKVKPKAPAKKTGNSKAPVKAKAPAAKTAKASPGKPSKGAKPKKA
jgi:CheY-like chemotaxis protein